MHSFMSVPLTDDEPFKVISLVSPRVSAAGGPGQLLKIRREGGRKGGRGEERKKKKGGRKGGRREERKRKKKERKKNEFRDH